MLFHFKNLLEYKSYINLYPLMTGVLKFEDVKP